MADAAAVLSGMLIFVALGQSLTLDMSLTFYMTLSLVGFLLAQHAAEGQQQNLASDAQPLKGHRPRQDQHKPLHADSQQSRRTDMQVHGVDEHRAREEARTQIAEDQDHDRA